MPIDPRIPFQATQGINTPFENLGAMLQVQQAQSLNAQRDATAAKLRAEQDEQARVRSFLKRRAVPVNGAVTAAPGAERVMLRMGEVCHLA